MGELQNKTNQTLGQLSIAGGMFTHGFQQWKANKMQKQKTQAEIAETKEQQNADKEAYKNDTIEATLAIHAHRGDSYTIGDKTVSRADYPAFDPEIAGKKLSTYSDDDLAKALQDLDEAGIKDLAKEVDDFRSTVLTDMNTKRLALSAGLDKDGPDIVIRPEQTIEGRSGSREVRNPKTGRKLKLNWKENPRKIPAETISAGDYKNKQLDKAYAAERELNERIAASRALKFDIKAATEKIQRLGGKL